MKNSPWPLLWIMTAVSAFAQNLDLAGKLEAIKHDITYRDGQVIHVENGSFKKKSQTHVWQLEQDRNYRLYLIVEGYVGDIKAELKIYDDASLFPEIKTCDGAECYHWYFLTFRRSKAYLTLNAETTGSAYVLVLGSAGRETPEGFVRTRVVDSQGKVYELIQNTVYQDGRKFYDNDKYRIVSLCVTPDGKLYMRTDGGVVLSRDGVVVKNTRHKVVKMVTSRNNKVYMLCDDSSVLDGSGGIAYKRTKDDRVVDLHEENGHAWIVAHDGKRVSLAL